MKNPVLLPVCAAAALALSLGIAAAPANAAAAKTYANCAALNKVYPHGVGRKGAQDHVSGRSKPVTNFTVNDKVYAANRKLDRDRDGIACEKH